MEPVRGVIFDLFHTLTAREPAAGLRTVFMSGAIEELWPERVDARRALADHHIQSIPEVLRWLGVDAPEEVA